MRRRQRGMTFIGLLFILGITGTILYAGIRLVPVYLNFLKVARSMDAAAGDFKGGDADLVGLKRSLEKHWQIEDIDAVAAKDVEVEKGDGVITMHVAYDDTAPYIANVGLTVHFDKTVKVQ